MKYYNCEKEFMELKAIVADMHSLAEELKRAVDKMEGFTQERRFPDGNWDDPTFQLYILNAIKGIKDYYMRKRESYGLEPMSEREKEVWSRIKPTSLVLLRLELAICRLFSFYRARNLQRILWRETQL